MRVSGETVDFESNETMSGYERPIDDVEESEVQLVWKDLKVDVCNETGGFLERIYRKLLKRTGNTSAIHRILKGVSGSAHSGNMIAIIGPSGAGKTTLLAALAEKIKLSSGSVKVNGCAVSKEIMSGISSYVPQFDALPLFLTVWEFMTFTCALKLDTRMTSRHRGILIENLLMEIGLIDCRHTIVVNLSGGQKKRLSLAAELVIQPKILFFDEPTTGLDIFAATQVVESLKTITSHGTIVFCTIHQPAMAIYEMFTHVTFMTDGRFAYFGTVQNSTKFFQLLNFHCPVGFDEVEYYMSLLSNRNTADPRATTEVDAPAPTDYITIICEAFLNSAFSKMPLSTRIKGTLPAHSLRTKKWSTQFYWILWRILKQSRRSSYQNWIVWISYLISIASIALFYMNINPHSQRGIQDIRGILFMTMSEIEFNVAYMVVYEFPSEIPLYLRERTMYGPGAYYLATVLGTIPRVMVKTFTFTIVLYALINTGLNILDLLLYCIYAVQITVCGLSYGFMISSWIENYNLATSVMVPIDVLFLLTAGVYYNIRTLPFSLKYLKYLSIFYYGSEGLSVIYWSRISDIECPDADATCLFNGQEVLAEYGYDVSNFYLDIGGLIVLTILMNFIGYIGVRRRRNVKSAY